MKVETCRRCGGPSTYGTTVCLACQLVDELKKVTGKGERLEKPYKGEWK